MLFVCHSEILHKHCLKFLLRVKMAPRVTENSAYANFGVTNKGHYGMLWYFLERSIVSQFPEMVQWIEGPHSNPLEANFS